LNDHGASSCASALLAPSRSEKNIGRVNLGMGKL
jgi:hypothetical protein